MTQSHLTNLKHPITPAHRDSAAERAGSCFPRVSGPILAAGANWRGRTWEHLVAADRHWHYTMGEQVPESFIMSQLLGSLSPSAKTTFGKMMFSGKYSVEYCKRGSFRRRSTRRRCWRLFCEALLLQYELACVHWWPGFAGRFR